MQVTEAVCDPLPRRQAMTRALGVSLLIFKTRRTTTLSTPRTPLGALTQRGLEAFDDTIAVARLREEADRSPSKCLLLDAIVGERGDEDDRHPPASIGQSPLEFDSAHPGHLYVQNEAVGEVDLRRTEERLS